MVERSGDGTAAVRASAEAAGARLEALYWMLGDADGVVILEAPDAQTAAAAAARSPRRARARSAAWAPTSCSTRTSCSPSWTR